MLSRKDVKFPNFEFLSGEDYLRDWYFKLPPDTEDINKENFLDFFSTMFERQEIWYRRNVEKLSQPWTDDKILRNFKFTNVYRELDRASVFLIKNILLDHSLSLENLIFRIIVYRFFNRPETFEPIKHEHWDLRVELPYLENFNAKKIHEQTVRYRRLIDNPWHKAYLMNANFIKMPKDFVSEFEGGKYKDYLYCEIVLSGVYNWVKGFAQKLREKHFKTPQELIEEMETLIAVSTFMSHEFYIDFCYVNRFWREKIMDFDEDSFTNLGPGASLGIRLIFPSLKPKEQIKGIYLLRDIAVNQLKKIGQFKYINWDRKSQKYDWNAEPKITLHQIEMWLCEYAKYWKMKNKFGKQRSRFVPKQL